MNAGMVELVVIKLGVGAIKEDLRFDREHTT